MLLGQLFHQSMLLVGGKHFSHGQLQFVERFGGGQRAMKQAEALLLLVGRQLRRAGIGSRKEFRPDFLVQFPQRAGAGQLRRAVLQSRAQLDQRLLVVIVDEGDRVGRQRLGLPSFPRIGLLERNLCHHVARRREVPMILQRDRPGERHEPQRHDGQHAQSQPHQHVAALQIVERAFQRSGGQFQRRHPFRPRSLLISARHGVPGAL